MGLLTIPKYKQKYKNNALRQRKCGVDGYYLTVGKLSKTWPLCGSSQRDTSTQRGSVHQRSMVQLPTRPARTHLPVFVLVAEVSLKCLPNI